MQVLFPALIVQQISIVRGHCRLRVVPIFPQEQQRERNASAREKHPTRERRDGAVIFTRACVSLALLSLRKNGDYSCLGLLILGSQQCIFNENKGKLCSFLYHEKQFFAFPLSFFPSPYFYCFPSSTTTTTTPPPLHFYSFPSFQIAVEILFSASIVGYIESSKKHIHADFNQYQGLKGQ